MLAAAPQPRAQARSGPALLPPLGVGRDLRFRRFLLVGFAILWINYFMTTGSQDIRRSLARAFDRAWDGYYRSNKQTLSQDLARTELAKRIVQLSKEGIQDERLLAKAGLSHLQALTRNSEQD